MRIRHPGVLLGVALVLLGCGRDGDEGPSPLPFDVNVNGPALLARLAEREEVRPADADEHLAPVLEHLAAAERIVGRAELVVDYPLEASIFPPDLVPPTVLWHDTSDADAWFVEVSFADGAAPLRALVRGGPPPIGEIDPDALGATNEIYKGTPYQQSARSWKVSESLWAEIKKRSVEGPARIAIHGFASDAPKSVLSAGAVHITTSADPVGAPIFYRDVPLMPFPNESGRIQPLDKKAVPIIGWRLRDISLPRSKLVLSGMPSCANCHSFSLDGKTLGMDVDGPQGDKGAYAIAKIEKKTVIDDDNVITWNSFEDKPEGHKTIGFLSRISPDGTYAITTLNESLFVSNFTDYKVLQVFYPTRGILAWYSTETGEMKALPGADSEAHVQCDPAWTPDGKSIVFARATGYDPHRPGQKPATHANDPNEAPMRYDLYRIPFDEGRGGTAVPLEGASKNGMSNTFPKVSPDGKWVVYTKCRNGQLLRPDGKLWIVPAAGGTAREMRCNTDLMNSWHSFSPNSRWMVFSSKSRTPYTQMFLTHIDENGNDSPAVLIPNSTAANRAVNIPEFLNAPYDALDEIVVPAVKHYRWLAQGVEKRGEGRLDEAIALFHKALDAEPEFGHAHSNLGVALAEKGQFNAALDHLSRAIESNREDASAWNDLGWVNARLGNLDEAMRHYRYALRISPSNPFAHYNLGLALSERGHRDQALEHFEQAVEYHPQFSDGWKSVGFELLARGRSGEALDAYRKALGIDPRDVVAHRSAGSILLERGDFEAARSHLESAIRHDPEDVSSRLGLAWHLSTHADAALRDGARAVEAAKEACELTRWESPGPLDVLAAAYAESGRWPEAVDAAKKAVKRASEGRGPVASGLKDRLALYEAKRPYRQPARHE